MNRTIQYLLLVPVALVLAACGSSKGGTDTLNTKVSNTTGWNYYDPATTNFQAQAGVGNLTAPGMVPIQGGTFTLGEKDEFLTAPRNNPTRTITVNSFYMDKYEISNLNWNEYLNWLETVFGAVAPQLVDRARPDETVWREDLAYNDPYERNYFTHPAFSFYPIVGVTWEQAMAFCQWRTDRVNEKALIDAGVIAIPPFDKLRPLETEEQKTEWETEEGYTMIADTIKSPEDTVKTVIYRAPYEWIRDKFVFNTEKYLNDKNYTPADGRRPKYDPAGNIRKATRADGLFITSYRLPTEAEWEFAAYAPVADEDGLTYEGKVYPWSGYYPRDAAPGTIAQMQANFVRGRGDMMGVSGALNDGYAITAPVDAFAPNDFGLYNMAGNVNEWVMDVYRETSFADVTEYNSFRGNIYTKPVKDEKGNYVIDSLGCIKVEYTPEDDRRNVKDGDVASILHTNYPLDTTGVQNAKVDPTDILAPKISKNSRVYKGGSWNDRIYWLNPSSRRFLDQDKCSNTIGFRCAMSTLGDQIPSVPTKK